MALCIEAGINTKAFGICCVAVGDNLIVRGAYQVRVGDKLTFPATLTKDKIDIMIPQLRELILTYNAMSDQGHAPKDFGLKAEYAINIIIEALQKVGMEPKSVELKDPKA